MIFDQQGCRQLVQLLLISLQITIGNGCGRLQIVPERKIVCLVFLSQVIENGKDDPLVFILPALDRLECFLDQSQSFSLNLLLHLGGDDRPEIIDARSQQSSKSKPNGENNSGGGAPFERGSDQNRSDLLQSGPAVAFQTADRSLPGLELRLALRALVNMPLEPFHWAVVSVFVNER